MNKTTLEDYLKTCVSFIKFDKVYKVLEVKKNKKFVILC